MLQKNNLRRQVHCSRGFAKGLFSYLFIYNLYPTPLVFSSLFSFCSFITSSPPLQSFLFYFHICSFITCALPLQSFLLYFHVCLFITSTLPLQFFLLYFHICSSFTSSPPHQPPLCIQICFIAIFHPTPSFSSDLLSNLFYLCLPPHGTLLSPLPGNSSSLFYPVLKYFISYFFLIPPLPFPVLSAPVVNAHPSSLISTFPVPLLSYFVSTSLLNEMLPLVSFLMGNRMITVNRFKFLFKISHRFQWKLSELRLRHWVPVEMIKQFVYFCKLEKVAQSHHR